VVGGAVPDPSLPPEPRPVIPPSQDVFPQPPDADEADEEAAAKRKRWLLIGIIGAGLLIALAVILILFLGNRGDDPVDEPTQTSSESVSPLAVEIPPVTPGMTLTEAETALQALELVPVTQEVASAEVERGLVIGFDPASGTAANKGDQVTILVSAGPDSFEVPDLAGLSQADARAKLAEYNLKAGDVADEPSAKVASGDVTRTEPAATEMVDAGTEIKLFVSNGNTIVPSVKGKTEAAARTDLEAAGLVVGENKYKLSSKAPGTVLSQSPKADAEVAQRTQVVLTLAREAITITVPNVIGLDRAAAQKKLEDAGLIPSFLEENSATVAAGLAIRSDPGPGDSILEGGQITVWLSLGPAETYQPVDPTSPTAGAIETQTADPVEGY
jgi:serine/threonine-protein kinase